MEDVLDKLTSYTFALRDALERTNDSSERPKIVKHLAAEMYALLHMHHTIDAIKHIVEKENRGLGLSYLSGEEGSKVGIKWAEFSEACGVGE